MKRLLILYILALCSCNTSNKKTDTNNVRFKFPVIIQHARFDSLEQWKTDGINEIFPRFIGQYKFTDTVNFDDARQNRNVDERQYNWEHNMDEFDTLASDGLQIYTDYNKTIFSAAYYGSTKANAFFPVYIVNETAEPKLFIAKDSYVFAIQEAIDTSDYNNWYAIEAGGSDFCGNGYFRRKLMPKEFIVFLSPKYAGKDSAYLRTRIKIGESVLISKPYRGSFDKQQFTVPKEKNWTNDSKKLGYTWMFYGARHKE